MSAVGTYLTDGTVTWIIEDATQADAVGDISLHPTLLPGHILADGSTVKASEYPRLLAWVQENSMTGTDDAHYTYDESADTLKVPNAKGRVLQGGAGVATKSAGLPNIKGATQYNFSKMGIGHVDTDGAISVYDNPNNRNASTGSGSGYATIDFDASRYNSIYSDSVTTVQPPAITLLAQIKY